MVRKSIIGSNIEDHLSATTLLSVANVTKELRERKSGRSVMVAETPGEGAEIPGTDLRLRMWLYRPKREELEVLNGGE